MDKKKILIISAVIIIIVLIIAIGYLIYIKKISVSNLTQVKKQVTNLIKKQEPADQKQPEEEVADITFNNIKENIEPAEPTKQEFGKDDLLRLAASFTERFGSYSNQANLRNITDLKIFMTRKMQIWADQYVADQRLAAKDTDNYYGITTKAVAKELKELDDASGVAEVLVKTRRQEASGDTSNVTNEFNQNIIIKLAKEDGIWKIDSALWQN